MSQSPPFTADHHGFYLGDAPFFPAIQDLGSAPMQWSNSAVIRLAAHLNDDLDWSDAIDLAQEYSALGKWILWEMDLGLNTYRFDPQDSTAFFSFSLALEEFSKKIWPKFSEHTLGVILYRGAFDPSFSFPLSKWEPSYLEWQEERCAKVPNWHELKSAKKEEYALYAIQNFAEYLHRLISFLPDAVLPFLLLDVSTLSAEVLQLFSKERFEHVHLILKGMKYPFSGVTWEEGIDAQGWLGLSAPAFKAVPSAPLGIYLPKDLMIDSSILEQMDQLTEGLSARQIPFRIIPEEKLTEQWDGLDRLLVLSKTVNSQGKRKLLGFIAAGGVVETIGEPLGLPDEVSMPLPT